MLLLHGLCDTLQANGSQSLLWQLWLLLGTRHEATRSNQSQIVSISLAHAASLALSHTHAHILHILAENKQTLKQHRTRALSLSLALSIPVCAVSIFWHLAGYTTWQRNRLRCRRRSHSTLPSAPMRARSPARTARRWRRPGWCAPGCAAAASVIIAAPVANIWASIAGPNCEITL